MKCRLSEQILTAVQSIVPQHERQFLALHEPQIRGHAWDYVKECLDSGWVSSVGEYVTKFECMLTEYTGVRYAVATVNGTAALHAALVGVGVQAGDEVLIPTLTFIATANAVSYIGAIPHMADIEEATLGLDPEKLNDYLNSVSVVREDGLYNRFTGRPIRAVVPMHAFGHPVSLDRLMEVCQRYGVAMVEDAAESLGSFYKGQHTGTFGVVSALSFNGNKIVTTGGGGAILTDDEALAKRVKHLTTTAKVPHTWEYRHDEIGFNYRMPNLNAALGCAQLEQLPYFIATKRKLFEAYRDAFADVPHVKLFREPEQTQSNYWLQTLLLEQGFESHRDDILQTLNEAGFMSRPAWTLIHRLPMYQHHPIMDVSVAESMERRIINIPSGVSIGEMVEAREG
jgi:perosamine synthetase